MLLPDILNKLKKVKRQSDGSYLSLCPAHPDRNPSLHIKQAEDRILVTCHAGCTVETVAESIGITMADLFLDTLKTRQPKTFSKIVAEYSYHDENSEELFQVVRYEPKDFRQRHKNGSGEWVWDMEGVRRVLYHLPDILIETDKIYVVEGEKDADNLWNWGQVATTSPGGANAWRDDYAESLLGKRVVIIPDKDNAGFAYARQVANSLIGRARELRCVILPDTFKDISDWLDRGGDIAELSSMEQDIESLFASDKPEYHWVGDLVQWDKKVQSLLLTFKAERISSERTGIHARVSIFGQHETLSWSYLNIERREDRSSLAGAAHKALKTEVEYKTDDLRHDLDSFCAGLWEFQLSQYVPEEMAGDDIPVPLSFHLKPYVVEGGGTIIFAAPGKGKSYTALIWAVSIDSGISKFWQTEQKRVLFINLERSGDSLRRRLSMVNKLLGLSPHRPLLTLNARGKSLSAVAPSCMKAIQRHNVGVLVLDSISRAGYGDLTENKPVNAIMDSLSSLCSSWIALAHTPRADESHVFGGVMFDAAADIVVKLSSEIADDGTLGIGYEIIKSNDVPHKGQELWAMEFDNDGLTGFRQAKDYEFPDVKSKSKKSMIATIKEFILNSDDAMSTATQIATATGFSRKNISLTLGNPDEFVKMHRNKSGQYYALRGQSHPF